ncbi:protein-export chaperone SecB [Marinomonas colpomeniae]|jgi:preprotein translocase subunit SecB|uniref:Protein-export protein SecB n=1 Tax=Marinomonas colpomeniae TaxID=2774408 RepID=A0ABR8NZH9_9GAMM|nr:protein-export chaperone SecB [Marinomonas colpomeniae]MBD5771010.1 protein-export chaperone SecB [Marinomonas colpomeniae]
MSDTTEVNTAAETQETSTPQLSMQRVFLKDISFESPRSPMVFQEEWKPEVGLELNTKSRQVGENVFEIVLHITVTVKNNGEAGYLVEIQQGGLFTISGLDDQQLHHALGAFCPATLFPYARENIDAVVVKGSFPAIMLAPINFDALYLESLQKQQAETTQ